MEPKNERVLKVDEAGRVWTPRELREAVLDEFERSGMPATQFAARRGWRWAMRSRRNWRRFCCASWRWEVGRVEFCGQFAGVPRGGAV